MKKQLLLWGVLILGIGGYFFYQKNNQQSHIITNFVPDNTLILLETNGLSTAKNKIVPRIPILSRVNQQYQVFKKIGLSDKEISNLLLKKTLYFAVLPVGKDNFSFVNYLPLTSENKDFIEKLEGLNQNATGNRIIPHTTEGFKISEVINSDSKMVFSYIIQKKFLIFSTSNLAVEEAILPNNHSWISSLNLQNVNPEVDSTFTVTHFNQKSISRFLANITSEQSNISAQLPLLFPETFQWLKPKTNTLEAVSVNNNQNIFEGQKSSLIKSLNMIPNSCSYILDFSFNNSKKMFENWGDFISKDEKISKLRAKSSDSFGIDYSEIYGKIQDEITLCSFDNSAETIHNKVLVIKQKGLLSPLNVIARNVAQKSKDDVFSVQYGSFMITNLGIKEFPSLLLGSVFGGFEECYFTEYYENIVLASSLSVMQEYLISVGKGDVWSNSPKHKNLLKYCVPANLTLIAENPKAFLGFQKILNTNWSNKIIRHERELMSVQAEIFQSNTTESRIILLKNIEPVKSPLKYANKWVKLGVIAMSSNTEPLYLVNPLNKNAEILTQGDDNKLHLFRNGKQIWNTQLSGKIVGKIKNSRVFVNSIQQFLCVTNRNIYILSRNEKGFDVKTSKPFKGVHLDNFKIFENETDHNQYLTLVSEHGKSYKFNKETLSLSQDADGEKVDGIITPFPSVMINNIEYNVFLNKYGKLNLQNANGKIAQGFPNDLKGTFNSPPILEGYKNNIVIRIVNEKGELFKIALNGKILEKKQLFRPDVEAKFSMAVDERGTDWVLMRTDGKEVIVMDKNERELCSIKGLIYGKKVLYYYNLGIGGKFFAINNGYETYHFYNEAGESVGGLPIETKYIPRLSFSDSYQKIIMNITTPTTIETWSVKVNNK